MIRLALVQQSELSAEFDEHLLTMKAQALGFLGTEAERRAAVTLNGAMPIPGSIAINRRAETPWEAPAASVRQTSQICRLGFDLVQAHLLV